jgi:polyhydroxyalkanoate synthesis regulator phasin
VGAPPVPECRERLDDLAREVKLRSQQVAGLRTQLKLQEQLIDSKNGEIQSLRIQIQLLEEQIKLEKGY